MICHNCSESVLPACEPAHGAADSRRVVNRRMSWTGALFAGASVALALVLAPLSPRALAQTAGAAAGGELERYVSAPDSSSSWREVASGRSGRAEFVEAILTSQTWQGIAWRHQLFVIKPADLDTSARAALLYIDGGSW